MGPVGLILMQFVPFFFHLFACLDKLLGAL
jgi:hypothetical protein